MKTSQENGVRLLREVNRRFTHPNCWVKGDLETSQGRCCLLGMMDRVIRENPQTYSFNEQVNARSRLRNAIGCHKGVRMAIERFNDHENTTFKDVKRVLSIAASRQII